MPARKLENYLDTGSLNLFARQIQETLDNVISVAIHDNGGQLAWAGPGGDAREHWSVSPFLREPVPGLGFCERLSNRNFVYVFYLGGEGSEHPMGTVSIQIDASHPTSLEFAYAEVAPVLACIDRQLEINSELSSIRRVSREGRRGLDLLVRLDEIDSKEEVAEQIRTMLQLSAKHFDAEMAAVLLPDLDIQDSWPFNLLDEESASKAVMTMLGSLMAAAKTHRKVLVSDANETLRAVADLGSQKPKVLCCPVMNSKDDVIGILVLAGQTRFSRDHIRLARAICVKFNTLVKSASQNGNKDYTRHTLLNFMDRALRSDPDQSHALLYVDVDRLHVVNDSYGHLAGDVVIEHVRNVIDEFANKDDAVSHLSGDCFGLFLHGADEDAALDRGHLVLDTLARNPVTFEMVKMDISASIGVVILPGVAKNPAAALNTAEMAARSAKGRGGNRCVLFQDADASVARRRTDLDQVNDLQYALIQDRFELHAQPIVSLRDNGGPARYEILIRMIDEAGKSNSSAAFIPAAERYQMMSAIDRWVIRTTLDQLGVADNTVEVNLTRFGINLSAQSLADDDLCDYIETCISESGISPDSLCFEITETTVVRNLERARRFIRRLRKLGCMVALDDFGTGYCSFAYLKDLPVHYVKIDGVFVRDVLLNPLSEAIVTSMVEIAKVMNALTIAEHVENELIFRQIKNLGIDFAQGFAVGQPAPLATVLSQLGTPIVLDCDDDDSSAAG